MERCRIRMVSNTPSPYCRPRSRASTVAARAAIDPRFHAEASRARSNPLALARVSASSCRGTESANDACAGPKCQQTGISWVVHRSVRRERADQDIQVAAAVAIQIPHRAGVGAAACSFEFSDDFHASHLGAAGDGAARKERTDHLDRRHVVAQSAAHVRDDVMDVCVGFDAHELIDADRATHADPAQIIAFKIYQHDVFCTLFFVAEQRLGPRQRPSPGKCLAAECRRSAGWRRCPHGSPTDVRETSSSRKSCHGASRPQMGWDW